MVSQMQQRLKKLRGKKKSINRLETIVSVTNSSEYSNYDLTERFEKVYRKMKTTKSKEAVRFDSVFM